MARVVAVGRNQPANWILIKATPGNFRWNCDHMVHFKNPPLLPMNSQNEMPLARDSHPSFDHGAEDVHGGTVQAAVRRLESREFSATVAS